MEDSSKLCKEKPGEGAEEPLINETTNDPEEARQLLENMKDIAALITDGAITFLKQEYLYLTIFLILFAVLLVFTVGWTDKGFEFYTVSAFLIGGFTSIVAGYLGMRIAVYSNVRTTKECASSIHDGFVVAFRGGQVLGFTLVGIALLILVIIMIVYKSLLITDKSTKEDWLIMFEMIAGYGLGGSTVALFGRVGGGIYTKAADVGADLAGKVCQGLEEDSPSNPGTIADNVGDNVGDIAGMGADLFGSLAESTCAALVVSATSQELL